MQGYTNYGEKDHIRPTIYARINIVNSQPSPL